MVVGATMYDLLVEHKEFTGESFQDVARRAGISRDTLRDIANLKHVPMLDTAARVSEALGVSIDALYRSLENERLLTGVQMP